MFNVFYNEIHFKLLNTCLHNLFYPLLISVIFFCYFCWFYITLGLLHTSTNELFIECKSPLNWLQTYACALEISLCFVLLIFSLFFLWSTSLFLLTLYYYKHINLLKSHPFFKSILGSIYSTNYFSRPLPVLASARPVHLESIHSISCHSFHNSQQYSLIKVSFELHVTQLNGHLTGFI